MTNLLSLITPTNLLEEQEKFLTSKTYNPTFHYIWQDQDVIPSFKNDAKYPLWEAIKSQDHVAIVRQASLFFQVEISDDLLAAAKLAASTKGIVSHGSAEEYLDLFRRGLQYFDLHDIDLVISDESGFNARPNHKDKVVTISRHIHFSYFSMEGGVHHELAHVLRYRNGKYNRIKRSINYLPTEEGLASWCQDNANHDNGLAQHAMEYVASSVGVQGSLRDIYDALVDLGMSSDLAWKRASRHKFGFVDTSRPGDILKPAMYYAGEMKVAELTTEERLRLFVGKIALDDLPHHPQYHGIWPAEKLITYFKLDLRGPSS